MPSCPRGFHPLGINNAGDSTMNEDTGSLLSYILGFIVAFLGFVTLWFNIRPADA